MAKFLQDSLAAADELDLLRHCAECKAVNTLQDPVVNYMQQNVAVCAFL